MTIVDVLWLVGLMAAFVCACIVEATVDAAVTPRGRLRSWLMWSAVGASTTSFIWVCLGHGFDDSLIVGLAAGLICQPVVRVWAQVTDWWDRNFTYGVRPEDDDWMKTASWRAGRGASLRAPPPDETEPVVGDDDWMETAIWRQGREAKEPAKPPAPKPATPQQLRAQLAVIVIVGLTWPAFTVGADLARDPRRSEVVTAYVEALGFERPRVRRTLTSAPCWGGAEYDWSTEAGDGRACVRDGDYVTLFVERDRTSKDPFARPAQ